MNPTATIDTATIPSSPVGTNTNNNNNNAYTKENQILRDDYHQSSDDAPLVACTVGFLFGSEVLQYID